MTTSTLAPASGRIAVPTTPAAIPPDATLDDLRHIKQEWLRLAQYAGYTEMCWQVLQWLGEPTLACVGHGLVLVCRLSNGVALIGSEHAEKRLVRSSDENQSAWLMKRSVIVWLESEAAEYRNLVLKARERGNVIDEIVLSSVSVAHLVWEYPGDEQPRLLDDQSTFLPGKWFNTILAALPDAKGKAQASGAEAAKAERTDMLLYLLAGQHI